MKLRRFHEAIDAFNEALLPEPNDLAIVYNIAELLLITGQISEYRTFASKHKEQIEAAYDGVLSKYFALLEAYPTGGDEQLRDIAIRSLTALPVRRGPLLGDWGFEELLSVVSEQPDSPRKTMLQMFIRVLTGEVSRDEAIKKVRTL
jgi:tetratricopeptide (TPR) repeat protein